MSQQQKQVPMNDAQAGIYGSTLIEALLPLLQLPNNDSHISERVVHGQHAIIYTMYQKLRAGGYDLHLSVKKDDPAAAQLQAAKQILAAEEAKKKVIAKPIKVEVHKKPEEKLEETKEVNSKVEQEVAEADKDQKEPTTKE